MKKFVFLVLALLMCTLLFACSGSSKSSCSVMLDNGQVETMSFKKFSDIMVKDALTSASYTDKTITGTGTITEIRNTGNDPRAVGVTIADYYNHYYFYEVILDDTLSLTVRQDVFSGFKVGDYVRFDGIVSGYYATINCAGDDDAQNPKPCVFHAG